jgi:phosphocarrier protein
MIQKTLVVHNKTGLHMRPGGQVVKKAKEYACNITIHKTADPSKSANGKSLAKLLKLAVSQGTEITITFDGADEQQAAVELEQFILSLTE